MAFDINPVMGTQRMIVERAISELNYGISIYLPNALAKSVGKALGDNAKPITKAIYDGMGGGVFPDSVMLRANKEIARRGQEAILAGWRARLPVKSAPYRRGSDPDKDRLSGKLGESLADSAMTSGTTARGISFLNTSKLSTDARHWYRVNYGAYGYHVPAIRRPKAYPVTVDGHTLFMLKDERQPAPNSWLPRGGLLHTDEGTIYPGRGPADREGGGHRAALFTDLGYKAVAESVDPVYRAMFFNYFRRGGMKIRYQAKGVHLTVTTSGHIS